MKFIKSIVSLVLCIAIMATTAVLAFAESDPNLQPVITQQPRDISLKDNGYCFPVSTDMKASVPGNPYPALSYRLYRVGREDKIIWDADYPYVDSSLKSGEYYFEVYNRSQPEDDVCYVKSDTFKVEVQKETLKEKFDKYVWNLSFVFALFFSSLRATIISIFR